MPNIGGIYEVIVGNIGLVYSGGRLMEARKIFRDYVSQSKINYGRAGGEDVTMLKYGEVVWEYIGKLSRDDMREEN